MAEIIKSVYSSDKEILESINTLYLNGEIRAGSFRPTQGLGDGLGFETRQPVTNV